MKIGGLQRVSLIDYPGKLSAIVFVQGCNFRCPYCHNPELVDPGQFGPEISETEVLSFLEKRRGMLDAVTVTGGEPTIQPDLDIFLKMLKDMEYFVKVDTNGSKPEVLETLIENRLVDYIAMDIKGPLQRYGQIASVPVDTCKIRKSIELITASDIAHEFRTTVVRSQLDLKDLLSVVKSIQKAHLYVLQPFVPQKTLEGAYLSDTSYTKEEFSAIRDILEKEVRRVVVR
jgi:pyruvate formate lyase activating enzyme